LEEIYFYVKLENCHIMELGSSNNNDNDSADENLWNGPLVMNGTCEFLSSIDELGYFSTLL